MHRLLAALVGVHLSILLGHDYAHRDLPVPLALWQTVYAYSIIVFAPLVATALLFTARRRAGYALLALAMFGAFVFGVYHHYVLISPDHVDHLPDGETQALFRSTAGGMALLELGIAGVAGLGWWRGRRAAPTGA